MQTKSMLLLTTVAALVGGTTARAQSPALENARYDINFAFDSAALPQSAPSALDRVVEYATAHPDLRIVLDGHADPIGSETYNVALSLRRAEAVRSQLVALGVDADRLVVTAFGEDGPQRNTYAADRRVTIWTTTDSVSQVIDRTFALAGTAVTWNKPMTTAQLEVPATDAVANR